MVAEPDSCRSKGLAGPVRPGVSQMGSLPGREVQGTTATP